VVKQVSKSVKQNIYFEEIVNGFFSEKEISELKKNYLKNDSFSNEKVKFSPTQKKQIEVNLTDSYLKQIQFDIVITFAQQKLDKIKYVEFLLNLGDYSISTGELSLAIDIHLKILNETKSETNLKNIAANACFSIGEIYSREAKWIECFEYTKKAFSLFKQQNDLKGCARCENLLGTVYGERGNLKEAANHFEESLHYLDEKKDIVLIGNIENNLGIINNIYSNYDEAISRYNRALINFQRLNDHHKLAQVRHNIGITYTKKKEYLNAIKELDKSIAISLNDSIFSILGISYVTKAFIYAEMEDLDLSRAFANKAMEICYKTNDKLSVAEIYKVEGMIKRAQKNYIQAESFLKTSLRINKEYQNDLNEAETNLQLGILYKNWKKPDEAKICFKESLKYFKRINAVHEIENIEQFLTN
jgi:tetratricopeptide (TPR) repeat protein